MSQWKEIETVVDDDDFGWFYSLSFFRFLGQTTFRTYKDKQQAAIDINGIRNSKGIWLMAVQIDCYQCGRLIEPLELGKLILAGIDFRSKF